MMSPPPAPRFSLYWRTVLRMCQWSGRSLKSPLRSLLLQRPKGLLDWTVARGSNERCISRDSTCFDLAWVHLVVTACGSTLCIYKDGKLAETATDGWEPNTLTRDLHCIGSFKGTHYFLNGTVAFMRTWDVALKADEVQKLYASRDSRN
mmetsp:Transcript_7759/g.15487  ORF Transcript_7759/g.15487 Transcript_7759/m.15487 type:complete len:149 (+) Transcript_7759:189-635(+)